MPQGLEVYDAAGNLVCGLTSRIPRILGSVSTGTGSGLITNTAFATGTPFAWFASDGNEFIVGSGAMKTVSFSGSVMSWSVGRSVVLYYGVY